MAVIGFSIVACKNNDDESTALDGKWRSSAGVQIELKGSNWTFTGSVNGYSDPLAKGTWSSSNTPAAGSSGTLTLTATYHWKGTPNPKTVTATYAVNAAGNVLTISNASSTEAPWWDALPGTYTKQ